MGLPPRGLCRAHFWIWREIKQMFFFGFQLARNRVGKDVRPKVTGRPGWFASGRPSKAAASTSPTADSLVASMGTVGIHEQQRVPPDFRRTPPAGTLDTDGLGLCLGSLGEMGKQQTMPILKVAKHIEFDVPGADATMCESYGFLFQVYILFQLSVPPATFDVSILDHLVIDVVGQ